MAFRDILGNERVKKILRIALQKSRVPNSLLFCGPEGVGKRSTARVVSKAMNCEQKRDDACENCPSCIAINHGNFPDVLEIIPEKNTVKIEQMRLLKQIAYLKPMMGKKRVFVVNEAEKMTEEAANSLLKVLEEPPLLSHIILLTKNPFLILPTIKSRCQILNFSPISREDIERTLADKGYEQDIARILSIFVRGNLEQALNVEWEEVQNKRRTAWYFFSFFAKKEKFASFLKDYTSSQRDVMREELEQIVEMIASYCRDLILLKEKGDIRLLMNPDYAQEMNQLKEKTSSDQLSDFLTKMDYVIYGLYKNLNLNLLVSSFISDLKEWEYV